MAVEAVAGGRYNSNSLSITGRPGGSATTWMSYQNTAGNGRGNSTARCSGGGGGAGGSGYAGDVSGDNRTKGGDGISSFNGFTTGETANFSLMLDWEQIRMEPEWICWRQRPQSDT